MRPRDSSHTRLIHLALSCALLFCFSGAVQAQDYLNLADIIAGGDGTGLGGGANGDRASWALNQDTGAFLTEAEVVIGDTSNQSGVNPVPVPDSSFIDVAFFIEETPLAINSDGVVFDWPVEDVFHVGYGPIMSNFTVEFPSSTIEIAGQTDWLSAVVMHSAAGVTFDLEALRSTYGADKIHTFSTFAGEAACSCNVVSLYIIYSNAEGIVDDPAVEGSPFFRIEAAEGEGQAYLGEIPAEAQFLTLAAGAADSDYCCDAAGFAEARIIPDTGIQPCVELRVTPSELSFGGLGRQQQLSVSCVDSLGLPSDVTADPATTYASGDETVATVDANGLVASVGVGNTQITVTNGDQTAVVPVTVSTAPDVVIDLSDLVARGDGSGAGGGPNGDSEFWALDQDTGLFLTDVEIGIAANSNQSGVNPVPVDDSDFVDVAFFIDETPLAINSEGTLFDWPIDDIPTDTGQPKGGSYGPILSNLTADYANGDTSIAIGGLTAWSTCVGLHAAAGLTFDLAELRGEHGDENVHTFSTVAGQVVNCDCGASHPASLYIIYSNSDGIVDDPSVAGAPFFRIEVITAEAERYLGQIPAEAEFLTLASGAANASFCCDWTGFAEAWILPESEVQEDCQELTSDPQLIIDPGLPVRLSVWCVDTLGLRRNVSAGATGTTYSVAPEGIVTVDEDGLVTGVALGEAQVTATHGALTSVTNVSVLASVCESISIPNLVLRVGDSKQLDVTCTDALGQERDANYVYTVDPEGVVTVDENGLVTAVALGRAQISAANADVVGTATVSVVEEFIDLADVVAGGDGTGLGGGPNGDKEFWAVHPDTGLFLTQEELDTVMGENFARTCNEDGVNPVLVEGSDFVDVVFIIEETPLAINSEGVEFDFGVEEIPTDVGECPTGAGGYGPIMSNLTADYPTSTRIVIGGRDDWSTVVGIHSAQGVTFDLEELRSEHGADKITTFSAFAGSPTECDCGPDHPVSFYIIYSNADGIVNDPSVPDSSFFRVEGITSGVTAYVGEIPAEAEFLTLATGAANASFCCDRAGFAEARISAAIPEAGFKRGDSNANGILDIGDPILNLGHQFLGDQVVCRDALDYDDGGTIDISDPIANLTHQFLGGPPPAEPGKESCGPDPTEDDLDCENYPDASCS